MKSTTATTAQTMRASLCCAQVDVEPSRQLGISVPEFADRHVRRPFVSNLYVSRGSAAV